MLIAVIKTGGKQYKVQEGDIIEVEKVSLEKLEFKDLLNGHKVTATKINDFKDDKVRILKFHPKKRYKRVKGHRQNLSKIKIEKIS